MPDRDERRQAIPVDHEMRTQLLLLTGKVERMEADMTNMFKRMELDMLGMARELREIHDAANRWKGGFLVIIALGAVIGWLASIGGSIGKFLK